MDDVDLYGDLYGDLSIDPSPPVSLPGSSQSPGAFPSTTTTQDYSRGELVFDFPASRPVDDPLEAYKPVSNAPSSDEEGPLLDLTMSGTGAIRSKRPKKQTMTRREVKFFVTVPPALPQPPVLQNPHRCSLLISKLAWSLTDSDVRRNADAYGSVRFVRFLENYTGVSTGVCVVQYVMEDACRRALSAGLAKAAWPKCTPEVGIVEEDLFRQMMQGDIPWLEGGECPPNLRQQLERIYGLQRTKPREPAYTPPEPRQPPRADRQTGRGDRQAGRADRQAARGDRSSATLAPSDAGWEDQLKALSSKVNSRGQDQSRKRPHEDSYASR